MAAQYKTFHDLGIQFPFSGSLSEQSLATVPDRECQESLVAAELRFLYSTQFLAESLGEPALEHVRERTYQPVRKNRILDMQIRDELRHAELLKGLVDQLGFDEQAGAFASGYTKILYSAPTLAEKVFIFQIMTEAVSSAYLQWRLAKIASAAANSIDREIYADEVRHLKMGRSLLQMCDPEELQQALTFERRKELVREMSRMCSRHFLDGIQRLIADHGLSDDFKHNVTDLDRVVARTILNETKSAAQVIEGAAHVSDSV